MLRFATFGSARAAVRYFLRDGADCARPTTSDPTAGVDPAAAGRPVDYYTERHRTVGVWAGGGAAALGLSGPITGADEPLLAGLLAGQLPDGQVVARPVWRPDPDGRLPVTPLVDALQAAAANRDVRVDQLLDGDSLRTSFARLSARADRDLDATAHPTALLELATAAAVDPATVWGAGRVAVAVATAEEKVDVRRAGVDGPLSAPKSVSVLWALADHHTQTEVLAAHRAAVTEAVSFLERWAGHGLRGHQGDGQRAAHVATDGLVVAAFEHLTSRADDPQLHTHLVIANLVHGTDGKWSALDTRALFRAQRTAGYLYQAVLRGQLTERLGVGWGAVRKGVAEIDGIPTGLCREFSTRRRAIEAALAQTGAGGVKAAQVACLTTRPAKSGRAVEELLADWWARAQLYAKDPAAAVGAVLHRHRAVPLEQVAVAEVADRLFGPDGITATETALDRGELIRALLIELPAGTRVDHDRVEALTDALLADGRVLPLIPDVHGARRYTTVELASRERAALHAADGDTAITPALRPHADTPGLSDEQQCVLTALVRSTARVDVVLGSAGAGKTVMLAALHTHYASQQLPVVGACLAAVTARRLEHATAIPSMSVARLAGRIRDGHPLPERCVLVVDEAGMVGTRHYATLLAEIARVGGKLVAVGDRAQLTEIDAGGMFAQLSRSYRRGELADNHRQIEPWERDALTALRNGELLPAWKAYRDHGRLHRHVDHDSLRARIAEQYLQSLGEGASPLDVVALTGTRRDADELNAQIREHLQQEGRLGADQTVGQGVLAVGELVLVTRNDNPRGLLNGSRGIVTAITARHVQLRLDDQRDVTVSAAWAAERLQPAYAMTVHKAQGLTVDVALVDTTALPDRNAGYVSFSRARQRTEIHHTGTADLFRNLADDPLTDVFIDVDSNVADLRRLRRHREQQLAVNQALPTWMIPTPTRSYDPYEHDHYLHHHRDNDRDFGRGR